MICLAAVAMAIRPEAHWRSRVWPLTDSGRPAASAAMRARFQPAVPPVSAVPMHQVFDFAGFDTGALDRCADGVAGHGRRLDGVERAAEGLGDRRAGGGENDGFFHA